LEQENGELQRQIMMLKSEIDRMNGLLRSKDEEIASWETRYRELEVNHYFIYYQRQIILLKSEIDRLMGLLRMKE
jgi:hypothetical protein